MIIYYHRLRTLSRWNIERIEQRPLIFVQFSPKEKSAHLAVSAAPRAKALGEKEEPGIRLTLTVQDMNAARSEIEKALAELGGRMIKAEPEENRILLTAELSSGQREALLNKLKVLGEVKGEAMRPEVQEDAITVMRIEILGARAK